MFDLVLLNNGDTILINQFGEEADFFDIGTDNERTVTPGTGTLQVTGGSLYVHNFFRMGTSLGGSGNLLMSGGSIELAGTNPENGWELANWALFGDNGDSFGNVISGGTFESKFLSVAFQATSTADLTISGTSTVRVRDASFGFRTCS